MTITVTCVYRRTENVFTSERDSAKDILYAVDRLFLIRCRVIVARVYALCARITYVTVVLGETAGRPREPFFGLRTQLDAIGLGRMILSRERGLAFPAFCR